MVKKYKCELTNSHLPKEQCYRFVLSPDGKICFDPGFDLIGKDLVVSSDKELVHLWLDSSFLSKKFGLDIDIEFIKKQILAYLYNKILTFIALAKKSGRLQEGKKQVDEKLKILSTNRVLIIQASDSSLRERFKASDSINLVEIFSSQELSRVLGKIEAKYVLVTGDFIEIILTMYEKYKFFSEIR